MAHGRCDQQDNSSLAGPVGPSKTLDEAEIQYSWLGPGHFGGLISSRYGDGRRVIWSNGRQQIAKLDYDTLEVLATLTLGNDSPVSVEEMEAHLVGLDSLGGKEAIDHAIVLAMQFMTGLDGVYALLDCDNTLFLGRKTGAVAYVEVDPSDPTSAIVERDRWEKPAHIEGLFVGANLTFDGRIVLTTDHGWVVCLARDFSSYDAIQLPGAAENAAEHCARLEAERGNTGYGWVRTSVCIDETNGIYVNSVDHIHRVVWTGERLSLDTSDGAWCAEYLNETGVGSGTTPSLMGFGAQDCFVVIGDGGEVVNITLLWRDAIPDDWEQLPGAPSRRIAGMGPANMGDPGIEAIQTEQSITVSGYGAMTVNNEPASIPETFPARGIRLLVFFLGHHEQYTPHGLHKFEWDPATRELCSVWINTEVSSPNSVPFVGQGSNMVYVCGTRDGKWTIEGVDWTTGESMFHYIVGGSRYNGLGAGVTLDEEGRILYGNIFGKTRLIPSRSE
ncbi:MAG: hypothetical protein V3V01_10195 [Acidimicrobiales bacterium]